VAGDLTGKKIAFLVAPEGIEQAELTEPWQVVKDAGGEPVLVSTDEGEVQAFNHLDKGDTFPVDRRSTRPGPSSTTGWSSPAGWPTPTTCGCSRRRSNSPRGSSRPASPSPRYATPLDPGRGRRARGQDADVVAEPADRHPQRRRPLGRREVHVDSSGTSVLITSRNPGDLPAFGKAIVEHFAG